MSEGTESPSPSLCEGYLSLLISRVAPPFVSWLTRHRTRRAAPPLLSPPLYQRTEGKSARGYDSCCPQEIEFRYEIAAAISRMYPSGPLWYHSEVRHLWDSGP